MLAASASAPLFNICTGKGTTVRRLAEVIADLCQTEFVVYHRPARPGEILISIGDPRRAAEKLGFAARTDLAEGLALTLKAFNSSRQIKAQALA
jgi:UDP-glucose 4-epimerase